MGMYIVHLGLIDIGSWYLHYCFKNSGYWCFPSGETKMGAAVV